MSMVSCAELTEKTDNEKNIRYIEKWISVYNKEHGTDVHASGKGIYILNESIIESEKVIEEGSFVMMDYDTRDMDGNITQTTNRNTALKLGVPVQDGDYYGAEMTLTTPGANFAGLIDGLKGLTEGSARDFLVPSWLMSTKNFSTGEEYLKNKTDKSNTIYSVKIREIIKDHKEYQKGLMISYMQEHPEFGFDIEKDTIEAGLYYKTLKKMPEKPENTEGDKKDSEEGKTEENTTEETEIYIDYTGTLIYKDYEKDGKLATQIFDTSIEKIAKDNGIWATGNKYTSKRITWGESANEIKMDDNGVISGFAKSLWKMKEEKAEEAICIFWSEHGYRASGSGKAIPGYAPISFKITKVESQEK